MKRIYIPGDLQRFANYRRALERAGAVCCTGEASRSCDALLLPGGGDMEPWRYGQENTASHSMEPERDAAELLLLDEFLAAGKPVLGVCRGLQVINVYFGGTLIQDVPGHSQIDGADSRHDTHIAPSLLCDLYGGALRVNSAHHQAAGRLGSGLLAVQWAKDGVLEGIVHKTLPVWAVQWHPERLGRAGEPLIRAFVDSIPS